MSVSLMIAQQLKIVFYRNIFKNAHGRRPQLEKPPLSTNTQLRSPHSIGLINLFDSRKGIYKMK